MFDFGVGYTEIFLIAVVAIIVIGPKELPSVLRTLGKSLTKMRGMAREFQGHLDSAMKDAGLDEVKKEFNNLKNINPMESIKKDIVSDVKKQEDDFKKLFGDAPAATTEPAKPAAPTQAPT